MTNSAHGEFLEKMDQLERAIKPSGAGVALVGVEDICTTYRNVKHILEPALPLLGGLATWVPGINAIVSAIQMLMRIADSYCNIEKK